MPTSASQYGSCGSRNPRTAALCAAAGSGPTQELSDECLCVRLLYFVVSRPEEQEHPGRDGGGYRDYKSCDDDSLRFDLRLSNGYSRSSVTLQVWRMVVTLPLPAV